MVRQLKQRLALLFWLNGFEFKELAAGLHIGIMRRMVCPATHAATAKHACSIRPVALIR
ncbi:hypothetical protein [Dyella silvatica]|uniref:hypothetical protein n=1 Tax=Dyella silvatica TaxID=2992128 RepID=UPI002258759E|nr:hypothetical protein [Dyella silvatica]